MKPYKLFTVFIDMNGEIVNEFKNIGLFAICHKDY